MLKEAIERFRDYFYEFPKNPVKLNDSEKKVKSLMPRKEDVINKRDEPITIKELKERAEEEFGLRQDTARKKAYLLRKLGVADKNGEKWAKMDRYEKLSEGKLKGLFIFIAVAFLGFSIAVESFSIMAENTWLVYFSGILLVIPFIICR